MRILILILCMVFTAACNKKHENNTPLPKDVVAVIDGQKIDKKEFDTRYEWYIQRFKYRVPKEQFLKNLVDLELSAKEAEKRGLQKDDKFQYDYKILLSQHLLEKEVYEQFKNINLSDEELKKTFEASPEIKARHILFKVDEKTKPEDIEKIKVKATKILDRAKKGEDFKKIAQKYSEGPSAKNGGDLDFFTRQTMVPEFSDAAFSLKKVGEIYPELVKTKYGFHIIKLTGIKDFETADKRRLKQQAQSQKQKEIYDTFFDKLRKNVHVQVNEAAVKE